MKLSAVRLFLGLLVLIPIQSHAIPKVFIPACRELISHVVYFTHGLVAPSAFAAKTPEVLDLPESYWVGRNKINDPWLDFLVKHGVAIRRGTFVYPHWENYLEWEQSMGLRAGPRTAESATKDLSKSLGKTADGEDAFKYARMYEDPQTKKMHIIDFGDPIPQGFVPYIVNQSTSDDKTEFTNLDVQNHLLARRRFFLAMNIFFYHDLGHGIAFRNDPIFYETMVSVSKDLEVPNSDGKSVFHDSYKKDPKRDANSMEALNSRYFQVMELSHKLDPKHASRLTAILLQTQNQKAVVDPKFFKPDELKKHLSKNFSEKELKKQLTSLTRLYDAHSIKTGGVSVDVQNAFPASYRDTMPGAAIATRMMKLQPMEYSYDKNALINRIVLMQGELIASLHYPPALMARAMLVPDRFAWLTPPSAKEVEAAEFFKRIYKSDPDSFSRYKGWDR